MGRGLLGSIPRGWTTGLLRMELRSDLTGSVFLCFQISLLLFPDLASAAGGEGTGELLAFGQIWGLCLSEVTLPPPLHSSPQRDCPSSLASAAFWVAVGETE